MQVSFGINAVLFHKHYHSAACGDIDVFNFYSVVLGHVEKSDTGNSVEILSEQLL